MMPSNPAGRPMAVILAAGEGRRMGVAKALLEYGEGVSFLRQVATTFADAGCDVLAVVGFDAARVGAMHPQIVTVENSRWMDGQLSSARVGIARALAEGASLILVHPVDVPTLRADTVRVLLTHSSSQRATVPEYLGTPGHPLLLPRMSADAILKLESAPTLEAALTRIGVNGLTVDDPGVGLNFNTPLEYERAFGRPPRIAAQKREPPSSAQ